TASLTLFGCDQIPKPISTDKADAATTTNAAPATSTTTAPSTSTETTQTTPSASGPRQLLPDFAAIVEANGKAVVNITATKAARSTARGGQGGLDESNPLYEFFRRFNIPVPEQ